MWLQYSEIYGEIMAKYFFGILPAFKFASISRSRIYAFFYLKMNTAMRQYTWQVLRDTMLLIFIDFLKK